MELIRRLMMLPPPASSVAPALDRLDVAILLVTIVGALGVAIALGVLYAQYRDRPDRPDRAHRRRPRHGTRVELALAAGTLGMFIAFWVVGFRQYSELREPPPGAMRVYVVAKQWMWQFAYADGHTAQDELRVPVDQPVELLMTSRDVIHSFYVPAFRLKQDVLPGRMVTLWFTATAPGRYDIFCAEYCGNGHSRMRGAVIALSDEDYATWASQQSTGELADVGRKLAVDRGCMRCHTADGTPHIGPTWRGLYDSDVTLQDGSAVRADDAYLTASMMDPNAQIVAGYAPIMPSYFGQLSGADAGAIVEYIRSLGGRP